MAGQGLGVSVLTVTTVAPVVIAKKQVEIAKVRFWSRSGENAPQAIITCIEAVGMLVEEREFKQLTVQCVSGCSCATSLVSSLLLTEWTTSEVFQRFLLIDPSVLRLGCLCLKRSLCVDWRHLWFVCSRQPHSNT